MPSPLRSTLLAAALVLAAATARAQTVTFSDGTFASADWSTTTETLNLGGTVTATSIASGGSPGSYREIDNTLNSAIGQPFSNSVFGFHANANAIFRPAIDGPISSIDYSEASIRLSSTGGVQACAIALRQNGVIYYGPGFLNPTTVGVWATTSQTGLTAANFDALAPGVQNPDFSSGGAPIQFGFSRSNSTSVGGGGGTTNGGIDNWSVTVHYDHATPAVGVSWGALKERLARGR